MKIMHNKDIKKELEEIRDFLNKELIDANLYLKKRGDIGQTHREDDPMETISFTRGKTVGFVMGRDRINLLLKKM